MSSIGKEEAEAEEHGNSVKIEITCITQLYMYYTCFISFLDFFF